MRSKQAANPAIIITSNYIGLWNAFYQEVHIELSEEGNCSLQSSTGSVESKLYAKCIS